MTAAPMTMPQKLACKDSGADFTPCMGGATNEKINPAAMPPRVISSGIMKCSKSIKVATTKPASSTQPAMACQVDYDPNCSQQPRKSSAVSSSTAQYRKLI